MDRERFEGSELFFFFFFFQKNSDDGFMITASRVERSAFCLVGVLMFDGCVEERCSLI